MKKMITRTLAAMVMTLGISTAAQAQRTITLSTYNEINFSHVNENISGVRMSRQFYAGYNSICLPFSVSASDLKDLMGEGVMLERMTKVEGNVLTFTDVTESGIEAGMPYLIYAPTQKVVTFSTQDMDLVKAPIAVTIGGATMSGNYAPSKEVGLYGIPAQQDTDLLQAILIRTGGDRIFYPTRCGISYPSSPSTPVIVHTTNGEGNVTAIQTLLANNTKVDIYTYGGQLVKKNIGMNDAMNSLKSGVYVVNGQKFIVK